MKAVVSACLLGEPCRYDGRSKPSTAVRELMKGLQAQAVCPECAGGLPVPRCPAERVGDRVITANGADVTREYLAGATACVELARANNATLAVLKAKSPACGVGLVYDGTHSRRLVSGNGIFAELLEREGICMVTEETVESCKPSVEHPIAIVLGTGLGHLRSLVHAVRRIDYHDIDDFPESARPIPGHDFEVTIGTVDGVPVVVYPGRIHLYQGYTASEVTALVRHAHRLGCRVIVFACATGAIPGNAHTGLGIITDHINLTGANPLVGDDNLRGVETPFVSMAEAYSRYLRTLARGVADDLGIAVEEGVYAGVLGPSFETPAEVRMLAGMGVSYVGMSTVCEVIEAQALGMNVLGLTLAANYAGEGQVSHQSVVEEASRHASDFESLVRGVLRLL